MQLLRLDLERQPVDLEQRRRPRARREDQPLGLVAAARGAHFDRSRGDDVPVLDALVEMHVRAVVDGDIEMRADRLFGKHDAGFASRTTPRFPVAA